MLPNTKVLSETKFGLWHSETRKNIFIGPNSDLCLVSKISRDLTEVTLACGYSRDISKSHATSHSFFHVLSDLTTMLLTLKQHKNHIDDWWSQSYLGCGGAVGGWGVIVLIVIYLQPLTFHDICMREYMQIFCFLKLRPKLVREILRQSGPVRRHFWAKMGL